MGVFIDENDDGVIPIIPDLPAPIHALPVSANPVGTRLPSILADIEQSVAAIPAGQDGALVGSYTRDEWVGAILIRVPGGWNVKAWVGKEDGHALDYGVGVLKTFKFPGRR